MASGFQVVTRTCMLTAALTASAFAQQPAESYTPSDRWTAYLHRTYSPQRLAFLAVEKARGERAMMPLALFGSASFIGLTVFTWLLWGALGVLMVLVPYVLITVAGYSGTGAGAALVPFALVLTVTSPSMGEMAGRIGPRLPLTIGALVTAGGFLLLLRMDVQAHYWTGVLPGILVIAIGMSGAVAPLTAAVLSSVDKAHTGSASGLNSAVARVAGMVAVALLGGVLANSGAALMRGFDIAMIACALAALAGAVCAFFLIRVAGAKA